MRPRRRTGSSGRAFTLIDLMIVVAVLGVLAAIVLPLVDHYVDQAADAAAHTTLDQTCKAVELYRTQHGVWPAAITPDLFRGETQPPQLPNGYALQYDPLTGEVTLVTP